MAQAIKTNNVSDNLVNREFEAHGPRMVLLTDITYVPIPGNGPKKFAYLSTILDAYTKQILAYKISDNLQVDFVLATVNQLFENHGEELSADTMLHSDQGCHYTSISYIELLKNKKLRQSMSRRGNCWDNSPQDSFFGHMKDEIKEMLQGCRTYEQVEVLLEEQIDYYNNHRYQWKLAKLSPNEFYEYYLSSKYPIEGVKVPESRHKV
jgi:transposase InsO family protein